MEHSDLARPVATPPERWFFRGLYAAGATLALASAPLGYFLTACTSASTLLDRLVWCAIVAVFVPIAYPGFVAAATIMLVALLLAASTTPQSTRIRNRVVLIAVTVEFVGALVYGAIEPARCSII